MFFKKNLKAQGGFTPAKGAPPPNAIPTEKVIEPYRTKFMAARGDRYSSLLHHIQSKGITIKDPCYSS